MKTSLEEREQELQRLLVKERKEALAADREARAQLATESWAQPEVVGWEDLSFDPPDYLIHGVIENGTVGMLAGQWGTGKSFIAVDLAACVGLGMAWHGHPVKQAANVLYVAAEGGGGMGRRRRAWELHHETEMPAGAVTFIKGPVPLGAEECVTFLEEQIRKCQAGFVIIDTLARCSSGLNENDAIDMGKVIETLYRLRDCRGPDEDPVTILIVHHHGKDASKGARGSSRLTSDVDFAYDIEDDKENRTFVMKCSKVKDGEAMNNFAFTLEQVELGDSHGTTSCVILHNTGLGGQMTELVKTKTELGFCGRDGCLRKPVEFHKYCKDCECKGVRETGVKCPNLGKYKGSYCGWHTQKREPRWEAA